MAEFTYIPDVSSRKKVTPAVTRIKFGDSYEQRQAWGINNRAKSWSLTFLLKTNTEADEIEAFLEARNGVEAFDWTEPNGTTLERWVCREWDRTVEKAMRSTIVCTFEQVFEPGV